MLNKCLCRLLPSNTTHSLRLALEGKAQYFLGILNLQHACIVCISVHKYFGICVQSTLQAVDHRLWGAGGGK